MGEMIDKFTKRKGPNAYLMFTQHFIKEYAAGNPGTRRFQGGFPRAITDPLVIQAWQGLSPAEREGWKERARENNQRLVGVYTRQLDQYVSGLVNGATAVSSDGAFAGSNDNRADEAAVSVWSDCQTRPDSSPAQTANFRRLLRPRKKRKHVDQSKYAPAFFEEISTAKQFEEKRRREREWLTSIWTWRYGENKEGLLDETFFLVSSQAAGVDGDIHTPGKLAFVELNIRCGIKREFACSVREDCADWTNGRDAGSFRVDCYEPRSAAHICREILGEWLRSTQFDLSSKTPVFFCLVDEFNETLDCLTHLYGYKEGWSSTRFSPYLLATLDDLLLCLLQYLRVPVVTNDGSVDSTRVGQDTLPLSSLINNNLDELSQRYSCQSHRNRPPADGASFGDDADASSVENHERCPLAVVRACSEYAVQWAKNGRVDGTVLGPIRGDGQDVRGEREETGKDGMSSAESVKTVDIDRLSCLALSMSSSDHSDGPLDNDKAYGALVERRDALSSADCWSDESADVIELAEDEAPNQCSQPTTSKTVLHSSIVGRPSFIGPIGSVRSFMGGTGSDVIPSGRHCSTIPALTQSTRPTRTVGGLPQCPSYFYTEQHRILHQAQFCLPSGCRGLGRGVRFDHDAFDW